MALRVSKQIEQKEMKTTSFKFKSYLSNFELYAILNYITPYFLEYEKRQKRRFIFNI